MPIHVQKPDGTVLSRMEVEKLAYELFQKDNSLGFKKGALSFLKVLKSDADTFASRNKNYKKVDMELLYLLKSFSIERFLT